MSKVGLRLLLIVVSLAVALGISELALRYAARRSVTLRYLSTAGSSSGQPLYDSLESYLKSQALNIVPRRMWLNFRANSLGFYDEEFQELKGPTEVRIGALGDSFCYGLVSYPANVQKVIEDQLRLACKKNVHVYNFGIPATGLWDYKTVAHFTAKRFEPAVYVLHFYMGNDGPDLLQMWDDLPSMRRARWSWYLPRFVFNSYLMFSYSRQRLSSTLAKRTKSGGDILSDAALVEEPSHYTEDGFKNVMDVELSRFYQDSRNNQETATRWNAALDVIRSIKSEVQSNGRKFIIVLYPSRLQVEEDLRNESIERLRRNPKAEEGFVVDMNLPYKMLSEFASKEDVPLLDITNEFREVTAFSQKKLYIDKDTHWNIEGNSVAAHAEGEFLKTYVCSDTRK